VTPYLKCYEDLLKWVIGEAYFICFRMITVNPMVMIAKGSLIPLFVDLLGVIRLRNLPNALKGGCGSSQDMMIVVHLVPFSIIKIMCLWICLSNLSLYATMKCPLGSMICRLICSIAPMNCCIRRRGDALDLIQDCRWIFIMGFGLPIRDPSPLEGINGINRVSGESHGPPL